jgi:hypothetical protein
MTPADVSEPVMTIESLLPWLARLVPADEPTDEPEAQPLPEAA